MKQSIILLILILFFFFTTTAVYAQYNTADSDSVLIQTEQQITGAVQKLEVQNAQLKLERMELEKRLAELNEIIPKNESYIQGLKDSAALLKQNRDKTMRQ